MNNTKQDNTEKVCI